MKPRTPPISGYLLAVAATLIWSGNFVIARGLRADIPPIGLAFWRWLVAVVALAPFALRALIEDWRLVRRHLAYLSVTALIGVTIFNTLIYIAGHTTRAINLSLIAASSPIFIVLLARISYREPITLAKAAGILITVAGVLILITAGDLARVLDLTFAAGDVWMLGAAIAFAGYSVLVKQKPAPMRTPVFLLSTFALGLLFLSPFYLWEHLSQRPVAWDRSTILSVVYVGVLASVVAFFLWNRAIAAVGPSRAALVYYLVPVFSGILAHLFLDEPIRFVHLVSMALIVVGILIANRVHE